MTFCCHLMCSHESILPVPALEILLGMEHFFHWITRSRGQFQRDGAPNTPAYWLASRLRDPTDTSRNSSFNATGAAGRFVRNVALGLLVPPCVVCPWLLPAGIALAFIVYKSLTQLERISYYISVPLVDFYVLFVPVLAVIGATVIAGTLLPVLPGLALAGGTAMYGAVLVSALGSFHIAMSGP